MTAPLAGSPAAPLWMHYIFLDSLVATHAGEVYFTNGTLDAGALFGIAASGGTLRQLAVGQRPSGLAADEANVYWADRLRSTVEYVPRSGGPSVPLASAEDQPDAMRVGCLLCVLGRHRRGCTSSMLNDEPPNLEDDFHSGIDNFDRAP